MLDEGNRISLCYSLSKDPKEMFLIIGNYYIRPDEH